MSTIFHCMHNQLNTFTQSLLKLHISGCVCVPTCNSCLHLSMKQRYSFTWLLGSSQVFRSLSCVLWYQKKIKPVSKLRIFNLVVMPTLLYGLESAVLLEPQIHRLHSLERCHSAQGCHSAACESALVCPSGTWGEIPQYGRQPDNSTYPQSFHSEDSASLVIWFR